MNVNVVFPGAETEPAELVLTRHAVHDIAAAVFLDRAFTVRTTLCIVLEPRCIV